MTKVRPVAKLAFERILNEKVEFLSVKCWPCNLKGFLRDLNDVIAAAIKMEVSVARKFSEEEIEELVATLSPLRTLEMREEVRTLLIEAICKLGVDLTIFQTKK